VTPTSVSADLVRERIEDLPRGNSARRQGCGLERAGEIDERPRHRRRAELAAEEVHVVQFVDRDLGCDLEEVWRLEGHDRAAVHTTGRTRAGRGGGRQADASGAAIVILAFEIFEVEREIQDVAIAERYALRMRGAAHQGGPDRPHGGQKGCGRRADPHAGHEIAAADARHRLRLSFDIIGWQYILLSGMSAFLRPSHTDMRNGPTLGELGWMQVPQYRRGRKATLCRNSHRNCRKG
jgi:hypothetical protein